MRKLLVPFAFLASTTAIACSFQVSTNKPKEPTKKGATQVLAPVPTPKPKTAAPLTLAKLGKLKRVPGVTPSATPSTSPSTVPTVPNPLDNIPTMTGTNAFGTGEVDPNGFAGSLYSIPAGTTKLPDLGTLTTTGTLFASTLNTTPRAMSGGFPGIDANKNEHFAIRWEAALVVDNEADYTFRVSSDDGSKVSIDGLLIVDNDGGSNTVAEKSGPVHLIKGTHMLQVDYLQTTGNVALQLFCKRGSEAEKICPTIL